LEALTEQGVPGLESSSWSGLMAPTATPDEIVAKINADANRALKLPSLQQDFGKGGIVARGGTVEAFGRFLSEEMARQATVVRKAGIRQN
jgi:tripartite-type tricarboxylate transporter receptor subunit TctC